MNSKSGSTPTQFGLLLIAMLLSSCDSSEELGPYNCANASVPADAQCFEFVGSERAFRYTIPEIVGKWNSVEFETCVEYFPDGTGVFNYWGVLDGVPRASTTVRWGLWLDDDGGLHVSGDGDPVLAHHRDDGSALDLRLAGITYSDAGGLGGDFEPVDSCPDYVESNQGVITFFSTHSNSDAITIALESFVVGELSTFITGDEPECGDPTNSGVLTLYRQPGSYRFQALSSVATWGPTLIEVEKGDCSLNSLR